jgi:heme A synthase
MTESAATPRFLSARVLRATAVGTLVLLFALLSLGAVVTSFRVGMADPIWPTRPWHLLTISWQEPSAGYLIEHTHRLAGFVAGAAVALLSLLIWLSEPRRGLRWGGFLTTIGLLAAFGQLHGTLLGHQKELRETGELTSPNWMLVLAPTLAALALTLVFGVWAGGKRLLGAILLIAVMSQGMLGGLRVYFNALGGTNLAAVHGVFSQVVLGLAVATLVATGPRRLLPPTIDSKLIVWSVSSAFIIFGQVVAGAVLRHSDSPLGPRVHLLGAFAVVFATSAVSRQSRGLRPGIRSPAVLAASLAGVQILLGVEAWMIRFKAGLAASATQQITLAEAITRTLHVLVGYGLFATAVGLAVVLVRNREPSARGRNVVRSGVHAEAIA